MQPAMEATVTRIKFSVSTNEEIVKAQPANEFPVRHPSQLLGNPALGLPLQVGACESCGATDITQCEGHFGFIELPVPVYHPSHVTQLRNILNMVCLSCLQFKNCKKSAGKQSNFTSCSHCQISTGNNNQISIRMCGNTGSARFQKSLPPLHVAETKKSNGARGLELRASSRKKLGEGFWSFLDQFGFCTKDNSHRRHLLPKEVQNIMTMISEKTRRQLAVRGYIPQDGFVMSYFPVPPNCLRAFNVLDETFMCSSDTSTNLLRKLLRKVHQISSSRVGSPTFQAHEVEADDLQVAIADYIKMRGTTKDPRDAAFTSQPAAKQWQQKMKSLFISKSSSFSSRGVITGDPYIPINVVGLPNEVARRMSVEERVTNHNIAQLQGMIDKGLCLTYKDKDSNTYSLDVGQANKKRIILKIGETVSRRITDGDIVFLNRPPSTDKHKIQALYAHVHTDHTIKINPLICGPLGADFDGDCVHIFYPRSFSAKAEAMELFNVEKQLMSSHNGILNFQLKNDCSLALKKISDRKYTKREAMQLTSAMFTAGMIPQKRLLGGPHWTFTQILERLAPEENKRLVRDLVTGTIDISSVLSMMNPREAIEFLNLLQTLLMESLHIDGFSISLKDLNVQNPIPRTTQNTPDLDKFRRIVVDFTACISGIRMLIDPKSDSAMNKVVEQIGFLGCQLHCNGRLYSSNLVEDCLSKSVNKCHSSTNGFYPLEAHGLVRSSFFHGLNPYEELLHSVSAREKIRRSSTGLVEAGSLFKNMMAMLRDFTACYDGTIRNSCSNSIVKFFPANGSTVVTPGDPVGILAATAVANAGYETVLDPNQNNMTSWDSMKEALLTRANSKTGEIDREIILYLNKCSCENKFCMERAALAVQACLKRIKVEDCTTEFTIQYEQQTTQATHCLVGHIHLDKKQLSKMNESMEDILQKCQEAIGKCRKKGMQMNQLLKRIALISSECMCHQDADDEKPFQASCLQFFLTESITTQISESSVQVVHLMVNTIFPILLDTIIKGDHRVQEANITWVEPQATCWVQNSSTQRKGELALEIKVEKTSTGKSCDAWGIAMDACIPVINLIDTTRSVPYSIQQVKQVFGISCAFDQATQHLSKAVGIVTKSVIKEHLTTVASSMTCTGNLHGFNSYGYMATYQSLKVQAPFMKATLSRPVQCFEECAEKVYSDQLDSVVSTCSWGNRASIGTGSSFEIHWNHENLLEGSGNLGWYDLYDFLAPAETIGATEERIIVPHSSCLYDVDNLQEDESEEDEVLYLEENTPIPWTDRPKAGLLLHDLQCWRTDREHQRRQTNTPWNSAANWQNDKQIATGSTGAGGWSKRSFTGNDYQRRQLKSNWSSDATLQNGNQSWSRENVTGPQNIAVAGPSSSGGWNRKAGNIGRGSGRGAVRKSEGLRLGGSDNRWKSQRADVAGPNFGIAGPSSSGGWITKNDNLGRGGGRGALWKPNGSHRGGSNGRNWKAQRNISAGHGGSSNFTLMEQQIHAQVEPIMKKVKRIIRESRDNIKLLEDDEKFIIENILEYHPEKEKKMSGKGNYIMVAKHHIFHSSRCLYIMSSDGSSTDFSYKKCLQNFIRIHYPAAAESFCRKYFK